ncbi:MAG: hypothetical protein EXS06_11490 [Planctomycetaceae bacterium]|nr:hypothetical protein [Planctomycetaceae bacterium]
MPLFLCFLRLRCRRPECAGIVWGTLVAVALLAGSARFARAADGDGPTAVLSLPGGTIAGRLVESLPAGEGASPTIRWQSPDFAGPFEFPLDRVGRISFDRQPGASILRGTGHWKFELSDGDLVVGRLESIDASMVVISIGPAEAPGRIELERERVRRISTAVAPSTYVWNGGLDHCQTSAASHWRTRAGGLASTTSGAMLRIDGGEGDRMRYDLALAWDEPPRVRLGFGEFRAKSNVNGGPVSAAYRIELTAEGLIVVRDEARPDGTGVADLAPCGDLSENGLTLSVFIDRQAGRIVVARPGETAPLCDLSIEPLPVAPVRAFPEQTGQVEGQGEGLQVDVLSGAVVLERLRISPWNGGETLPDEDQPAAVELNDGRVITGNVTGLSDDGRALVVVPGEAAGFSPQNVLLDSVAAIRFPAAAAPTAGEESPSSRRVRVSDRFGSSLTGELIGVAEGNVTIKHAAITAPVSLPIGFLEGIGAIALAAEDPVLPGRVGRLELEDTTHDGCLVPVPAEGAAAGWGAIGWLPRESLIAAPFAPAADGSAPQTTIRYDESSPNDSDDDQNGWIGVTIGKVDGKATITEVIPGGPFSQSFGWGGAPVHLRAVAPRGDGVFVATEGLPIEDVMCLVQGRAGTRVQLQVSEGTIWTNRSLDLERALHPIWGRDGQRLREVFKAQERLLARAKRKEAGDTEQNSFQSVVVLETGEAVVGDVESIDEGGVRLLREGAEPVTIPASAVKAVELVPKTGVLISPEKFRSLTTLPRSQRFLPPTHLVRSMQGDYLRGRLESMDGENLRIAVDADPRGKPLSIPRQDVARVIWLHPESLDPTWQPEAVRSSPGLPVEAVTLSVGRLRMAATGIEGNVLVGSHAIFGPSRIDLNSIDRLLIGGVLEETPKRLPYAQWQLQPAAEPRNLPKQRLATP